MEAVVVALEAQLDTNSATASLVGLQSPRGR
jgi:hypothetical protein